MAMAQTGMFALYVNSEGVLEVSLWRKMSERPIAYSSEIQISDNRWRKVEVQQRRGNMYLRVDDMTFRILRALPGKNKNRFDFFRFGGNIPGMQLITELERQNLKDLTLFGGCMRAFEVNGVPLAGGLSWSSISGKRTPPSACANCAVLDSTVFYLNGREKLEPIDVYENTIKARVSDRSAGIIQYSFNFRVSRNTQVAVTSERFSHALRYMLSFRAGDFTQSVFK